MIGAEAVPAFERHHAADDVAIEIPPGIRVGRGALIRAEVAPMTGQIGAITKNDNDRKACGGPLSHAGRARNRHHG
jgi:hypothetical protein